jgi:hypothetical protein
MVVGWWWDGGGIVGRWGDGEMARCGEWEKISSSFNI